ncbi:hypothetical protein I316_00544 [Kwoniella heveanensis BCC8398]|uniref:Uncharacterized protein n=1 Tax=Kwoniella heveanensis BCC8398 TaxID=1296120 RepID=A0A1B9H2C7_9TREE|nr:hypothetical protein I316_00544 [Kwoniella heveanensis BCC8398]
MTNANSDSNIPLPASQTKHLSHLSHPLPRHPDIHLPLRQISSSSAASSTSSISGVEGPNRKSSGTETGTDQDTESKRHVQGQERGQVQVQSTGTTGTTLWLSAQILALYLSTISPPGQASSSTNLSQPSKYASPITSSLPSSAGMLRPSPARIPNSRRRSTTTHSSPSTSLNTRPKPSLGLGNILELGGGIGYTALTLASAGWSVTTTDIEPVLSTVLCPNVETGRRVLGTHGLGDGVCARGLDWFEMSEIWRRDKGGCGGSIGSAQPDISINVNDQEDKDADPDADADDNHTLSWVLETKWDMIIMTDTFYAPQLVDPLWETLLLLSHVHVQQTQQTRQADASALPESTSTSRLPSPPTVYIALERRDPRLITQALERGKSLGFDLKKINRSRLSKEVSKKYGWDDDDWDGVEIWKGRYKG